MELDPHQEISKPLKNDAPSRFWSLVEPYCADITQDTIRTIEDLIVPQESDKDFQEIPELGKHYSETWPLEDLKEEMIEGSKSVENNKGLFSDSAQDHTEVERILKLGEDESSSMEGKDEASLYDKLVYSLISENLMTHSDNIMTDDCDDDVVQRTNPDTVQEPTVADNSLEKRMRAAFVTAGLLEPDEEESKSEDDEISQEIKKIQAVLIPVQEYNTIQKKKLLSVAKAEMAKQEVKKKLQEHDAKVMEIYRTVAAARENKTMNKKLEDEVKKVLRERKKLEEKISQMQ
ncbi:transcriptional adapter 3-B [Trichonephila clavipes]|nr:transcriptional adapter 3-B [Trichonephila clavipes]